MKTITFICILAMVIIVGCSQKKPDKKTILNCGEYAFSPEILKGEVKKYKEQNYWAIEKDGKIIKGDLITWKEIDSIGLSHSFIVYFDKSGSAIRYDLLYDDNTIKFSSIFTYANGKCIRRDDIPTDSTKLSWSMQPKYWIPLSYNVSGRLISGADFRTKVDTLMERQISIYDDKGNIEKMEFFDSRNKKWESRNFSYDSNGNVTQMKFFGKNDSLVYTVLSEFNDAGFLTKIDLINENPRILTKCVIKDISFDDHGNLLMYFNNIDDGKYKILCERSIIYY
jgi:hypothetical protein